MQDPSKDADMGLPQKGFAKKENGAASTGQKGARGSGGRWKNQVSLARRWLPQTHGLPSLPFLFSSSSSSHRKRSRDHYMQPGKEAGRGRGEANREERTRPPSGHRLLQLLDAEIHRDNLIRWDYGHTNSRRYVNSNAFCTLRFVQANVTVYHRLVVFWGWKVENMVVTCTRWSLRLLDFYSIYNSHQA